MKTISISELKTHLSSEIKALSMESEVVVLDRNHPVAVLSSYDSSIRFSISPPRRRFKAHEYKRLGDADDQAARAADPIEYLMDERGRR